MEEVINLMLTMGRIPFASAVRLAAVSRALRQVVICHHVYWKHVMEEDMPSFMSDEEKKKLQVGKACAPSNFQQAMWILQHHVVVVEHFSEVWEHEKFCPATPRRIEKVFHPHWDASSREREEQNVKLVFVLTAEINAGANFVSWLLCGATGEEVDPTIDYRFRATLARAGGGVEATVFFYLSTPFDCYPQSVSRSFDHAFLVSSSHSYDSIKANAFSHVPADIMLPENLTLITDDFEGVEETAKVFARSGHASIQVSDVWRLRVPSGYRAGNHLQTSVSRQEILQRLLVPVKHPPRKQGKQGKQKCCLF